jgi:hypothetical protein
MPSLADLAVSVSPLADPLSYPGLAVDADYLWLGGWMYGMGSSPGLGLADWAVPLDGGPLATGATGSVLTLGGALARAGAAPIDARYPVVSFGSNSAPAQLRDKFAALDAASGVIPVTRGSVGGLSLGYSAHVSVPGYVPYVLVDNGSPSALPVFLLWLDSFQLAVMNGTEPNYRLVPVPADRYPLTLDTGQLITGYSAYKGKWGALRIPGSGAAAVAGSQQEVFDRLNEASWFRALAGSGDVRAQISRLRADAGLRERVRTELAARGWVAPDGWAPAPTPPGTPSAGREVPPFHRADELDPSGRQ